MGEKEQTLYFLVNANSVSPDVNGYGGRPSSDSEAPGEFELVAEEFCIACPGSVTEWL